MSTVVKDLGAVSAYAYAVEKGYTGTEAEFAELMADYAEVGQRAEDAAESASASATASAQSASQASASEQGCERAVLDATSAAAIARARADEASGYAQTASTKASEAVGCVETATQKATESAQSASQALGYKNDAESARDEAQDIVDGINAKAEQIDNNTAEITELKNDGVAPSAEQLLSKNTTVDTVLYHFRQTGGNGADREYLDAVVGGTVGWNQLANVTDGKYVSTNAESTLNTIKLYFRLQNQLTPYIYHETISSAKAVQTIVESTFTGLGEILHNGSQIQQKYAKNMNIVEGHKYLINLNFTSVDINTVGGVVVEDIMCIDLTSALGSAIADYLYSLEHATAGTGVVLFKQMFPNDYYEYNAGELKSVEGVSAHKTVGFNQWDEQWEVGQINGGGTENTIHSKNFCKILPNTTYYATCGKTDGGNQNRYYLCVFFYDASKNFISAGYYNNLTFTTPQNAAYFKIETNTSTVIYGNTYHNDICINISDPAKNGTYEPYKAHNYPLDSTLTLRGIPKLSDGKIYYDGDKYLPDGKVERRYRILDLGTQSWTYNSANNRFDCIISGASTAPQGRIVANAIALKYETVSFSNLYADTTLDKCLAFDKSNLRIRDTDYTDAATFKTAMSGVMLVYELATPTTETADPYQHLQQCDPNGTEEYISTGIVPVGHNSFYPENLKAKIEGLPWNFANLIAPTESAFVATRNYVTGDLFIVSNVLYKATSNIANGGTITPNTNCTATTLAEIISALA